MDRIEFLIKKIQSKEYYKNQIVKIIKIPAKEPVYNEKIKIHHEIKKFLNENQIDKLFSHQVEAINSIRKNKNVIIATPTASGKTLIFNIPILEAFAQNSSITALYVYPAKALSNDQLNTLLNIKKITNLNFETGIYDGDTPPNKKKILREKANIIITNPYELHQIIPYHNKWKKFFKNLKFIVLDEAHRYRGIFGSNIAMLLRRLKRILEFYGSKPQFIISTASLSNPEEFCFKLTGENFELVNKSGSPSGIKYLLLWDSSFFPERTVFTQTKDILLTTTQENFQTLCFTTSRKMAELISIWAKKEEKNIKILSYRAGYLPETRRDIEKKLKNCEIKGVVSTNALELGIDIGQLDVIIISGYPGSITSFWQQAGRAGRKMQESIIIYLPYEDALEKYLLKNPEILLNMNFENAVISLENPNILAGHLLCASAELPLTDDKFFCDITISKIINSLLDKKLLSKTPRGFIYSGTERPHNIVSLDNISGKNIKIKVDNKILETISINRAFREAHTGAVYLYQGETYIIKELNIEEGIAYASKENTDLYTEALKDEHIKILDICKTDKFKNFTLYYGKVSVTEIYKSYKTKRAGYVVSYETLNLPPLKFTTEALWLELNDKIPDIIRKKDHDFEGAIHAAEHGLIALSPVFAMCEPDDLGGVSYPIYENGKSIIFIYDGYEGGIGIGKKLYEIFPKLNDKTIDMLKNCECENGCPYCVYSSKCGNNNNPIDKAGALEILKELI